MRVSNPYKSSITHDAIRGSRNIAKPYASFKMVTIIILLLITAVMFLVHFHMDNSNGNESYHANNKIIKLRGSKKLNNPIDSSIERNENNINLLSDRSKSVLNTINDNIIPKSKIESNSVQGINVSDKIDRIGTKLAVEQNDNIKKDKSSLSLSSSSSSSLSSSSSSLSSSSSSSSSSEITNNNKTISRNHDTANDANKMNDNANKNNIIKPKTTTVPLEQQNISNEVKNIHNNYDTAKIEIKSAVTSSVPNNLDISSPTSVLSVDKGNTDPNNVVEVKPAVTYKDGETACNYPGLDPFKNKPVETFVPPITAPISSIHKWEDSLNEMLTGISHMSTGGTILRNFMQKEVRRMQELRFDLFCKYV